MYRNQGRPSGAVPDKGNAMTREENTPKYKEIAPRLFGLRESLGLDPAAFAAKVKADVDLVAGYEQGDREIPVSYLMDVAHACGIDLTELLSGGKAYLHSYTVVRAGEGFSVSRRKDYGYKNLAARFTGRLMEPFLIRVPPKNREDVTLVSHKGQEFSYILEGRLELHLGENITILEPGDCVYFSSTIPHGLRGLDGKEAVFVSVII
jgi:mannose-6-phosphate isomerase-like protein (cupin superfamily)